MASLFLRKPKSTDNASPEERKRKPIWWAQFYAPDPETGELVQVRRSTGKTTKKEARDTANDMERAAKNVIKAGSEEAQKARAVLAEAVAAIEQERFTPTAARKYLARLLEIATGDDFQSFTVESWIKEWLRRKGRESSKATIARYTGHTKAFLEWLGSDRAKKPLESITTADVRRWRESLQDSGRAGKTVLAYQKDIGAVYRAAVREGLVAYNPVSALDAIATDDSLDRKPFTGEEVGKLIQAAPSDEWRGLILTAAFTGLRLGDASRLSWSAVDLAEKKITLIPSKTKRKKREVRIPIQPDLLAYLMSVPIKNDAPDAPVFPVLSKTPLNSRNGLSLTFPRIMHSAGVDRGKASRLDDDTKGAGRVTYERGFHSLRHTFTSWLRSAGVSEEDRMSLTGHSTRAAHAIYSHADESALRDAIAKLPSIPEA